MKDFKLEDRFGEIVNSLLESGYSIDKAPGAKDVLLIRKGEGCNCGRLALEKYCINLTIYDETIPHSIGDTLFKSVRNYLDY